MTRPPLLSLLACLLLEAGFGHGAATADTPDAFTVKPFASIHPLPGSAWTSWIGNTFGGNGGENGFGYWVQNGADEIEVTPDGTVFAGVGWDEAGRCAGLYKNGVPNRVLLKVIGDTESAWGWGTGNNALATNGRFLYIANTGKRLLRFRWTPGSLDSAMFEKQVPLPDKAVGLTATATTLAVVYPNAVEWRKTADFSVIRRQAVSGARDAGFASDGSLWVLAGHRIRRYTASGAATPTVVPGLQAPSALSFAPNGALLVCDNGPRQQVLYFDVTKTPRLVKTFGIKGGLASGIPGEVTPTKLFALAGAGADVQGNLYVAMSFGNGPNGNLFLRSFTPKGALRWEAHNTSFVDTYGFDPQADGAVVFGRTVRYDLSLARRKPGTEATLRAVTVNPLKDPKDDRLSHGCSVILRHLAGKKVMFTIGQYAGGYRIFTFPGKGFTAKQVAHIGGSEQWAWDVDSTGAIWHGDAPGNTLRRYAFKGWNANGSPNYDWTHPQTWPWPQGWSLIRRIAWDAASDTLFLCGYLTGDRVESWGIVGATLRRYDGWMKGKPTLRWSMPTPHDGNTDPKEGPLSASSLSIAGEYLFFGMVKPTNGKQYVHVFRQSDAGYVGSISPGPSVGSNAGWLDMPYSMQAFRRANGEYLILVEEDFRGKNLLYRWTNSNP